MGAINNTCRVGSGRLLEITVDAGYRSAADVDAMISMIGETFARLPASTRVVIAADWRGCHLMPATAAERAHRMLTTTNERIERSAILMSPNSSFETLQFMRLVRESQHPNRRVFQEPGPMRTWLSEVLTLPESHRLAMFLARVPAA